MAVEKMKKILVITINNQCDELLAEFQKLGTIHFKELEPEKLPSEYLFLSKKVPVDEYKLTEYKTVIHKALKELKAYTPKKKITSKRPVMTYEECCSFLYDSRLKEVYEKVESIIEKKNNISQECKKIKTENTQLTPYTFLDFPTRQLSEFKKVYALLISIKENELELVDKLQEDFPELYREEIGQVKHNKIQLVVIEIENKDKLQVYLNQNAINTMDLNLDRLPTQIIQDNLERLNRLQTEMEQCKQQLRELGYFYDKILIELDALNTIISRNLVVNNFLNSRYMMYMEGWVPERNISELCSLLDTTLPQQYYLDMEEVSQSNEEVPIKLKNRGIFSSFENITEMFSLPRYNELDPTGILTIFYLIFFGMMVGDVGYGLLLTLGCAIGLKLIDFKDKMRKSIKMFLYLGLSVIVCGTLYGSIFGITFFTPIPVQGGGFKPILDTQTDIVLMLIISLVIGLIQIICGLIMKGINCYRQKDYIGIFCDCILWILTLMSGILLLLTGAGILEVGSTKLYGSIFGACIVGLALTQGRGSKTIGGKIGGGLYGVYGLTSYVGDIVSYTRIVALGLSGAYIAFSFNLMSELIPGTIGRILFGTIIFIFGQTLNFGLSLLGAYVHSCRLQYVEFFGKFYSGGGKSYKPFKVQNEYISIKKLH